MSTIYLYPRCGTCRKAEKWLKERGLLDSLEILLLSEQAPQYEHLEQALKSYPLRKLFNTSGQLYREMELKKTVPTMEVQEGLKLLSEYAMLVKRPFLVLDDGSSGVGFNEDYYQTLFENRL